MKFVIIGGPGAGKGSLSKLLAADMKIPHISSGDICRENIAAKTHLGREMEKFISKGNLVPDDIITSIVLDRVRRPDCARGFVLDGFPRTIGQAIMLEPIGIDYLVRIVVSPETVIARLCGRFMCKKCGAVYNKMWHDITKCSACGGELWQREDDREDIIRGRIETYKREESPILEFYRGGKNSKFNKNDRILEIESILADNPQVMYQKFKEKYGKIF